MTIPSTGTDVVIRTYGPGEVSPMLDVIADIWADAHPELLDNPGTDTDGLSVSALHRQITGHLKHRGFALAVAYSGGTPVGFGYAFPCSADYWFGPDLVDQVPEGARTERLMGLCELAVRPPWQSRGIGTRLHTALVKAIDPAWSSLLVLPSNRGGRDLYTRLGYTYAGPYRNGPVFDLLLLRVPDRVESTETSKASETELR
ncbi:GNAT family N-acetyltransferase [Streptomyces yaizuensis]|uniref:GNAT family N-acetyltransferase n=1 Tax=Streptomyces yaizuensis TaxID=2989713 RepID=A0ABQ5P5D1_9ACTN|nr:GNAT family N-acetyltransferase [Streptomyces sp. YSPA8]GLF97796.1 GNAT family N-acetyltransferase [Streptomyces sp. YSPA8]